MRLLLVIVMASMLTFAQAQEPQFRGGVELVTVDVRVVGADGQPIVDLRPEDISLKVDGKQRPIKSLGLLRVGVTAVRGSDRSADSIATSASGMPMPSLTGRTLVLVFDHEHIRPTNERQAVEAAIRAMDGLTPVDRVALVTIPNGRIEVNLTTEHDRVRRALPDVVGRDTDVPGGIAKPEIGCTLVRLIDLLRGMEQIAGPKTFVLVSEGFGCDQSGHSHLDNTRDLHDLATVAANARAQFYVVQPNNAMLIDASRKLPGGLPDAELVRRDNSTNMLEDIAGVTGGDLFRLSGTADPVFQRILRETSAYYELGFEPLESERNGRDHSIAIKVNRPKVTLRARSSFAIPKTPHSPLRYHPLPGTHELSLRRSLSPKQLGEPRGERASARGVPPTGPVSRRADAAQLGGIDPPDHAITETATVSCRGRRAGGGLCRPRTSRR